MDGALRTSLWNALEETYWSLARSYKIELIRVQYLSDLHNSELHKLARELWRDFYKRPLEEIGKKFNKRWPNVLDAIRAEFFRATWWAVYDFIEFVSQRFPDEETNEEFRRRANSMLEREASAWRLVGGWLAPIISDEEIVAIEGAAEIAPGAGVREHLETALRMLADRTAPDYRNSIKESISAVEATVRAVTGDQRATLGQALKLLDERHGLHPAMKEALSKLYGYTNDDDGIRHALMEENKVTAAEARFMLVICSAFVSFLTDPGPA